MDKEEIELSDWKRIIFGNVPLEFMGEVLIRTLFTYFILLIVIRLMGKRMSGQLTSTEMAVMLLLGAIIAVPMQSPERGVLQGVFMLLLIYVMQQVFSWWMVKSAKTEYRILGQASLLIKNGVIETKQLMKERISREQLFTILRGQQIFNLAQVKRLYLEASGDFSTYKEETRRPGLSILPRGDNPVHDLQQKIEDDTVVCVNCGNVEPKQQTARSCTACGANIWESPVI